MLIGSWIFIYWINWELLTPWRFEYWVIYQLNWKFTMAVSVLDKTCSLHFFLFPDRASKTAAGFQDGAVAAGPVVCEPLLLLFGWALVPRSVERAPRPPLFPARRKVGTTCCPQGQHKTRLSHASRESTRTTPIQAFLFAPFALPCQLLLTGLAALDEIPSMASWVLSRSWVSWTMALVVTS